MMVEGIQHPGAVCIVPFLSSTKVVMIRQFRPVINTYIYEFPAGTREKDERPDVCARREIIEEIGYKAKTIKRIGDIYLAPGYSSEKIILYEARSLIKTQQALEPDEVLDVCIFSKREVRELFHAGKITDAKTICAMAHTSLL